MSPRIRIVMTGLLLIATFLSVQQIRRIIHLQDQTRFSYEAERIDDAILQRMRAYMQVLRGGVGLFAASDEVTREDWRHYVETLSLSRNYPGIRSMTFAPAVPNDVLPAFIERIRSGPLDPRIQNPSVLREFVLRPPPPPIQPIETYIHAPVLYTEPLSAQNEMSIGVDMMQDAGRHTSMLAAVAYDDAVLSPRLRLLRLNGTQVGFLAYLPIQEGGTEVGWVSAGFFAEDFMRGLLPGDAAPLEFEIFVENDAQTMDLLYSTAGLDKEGNPEKLPEIAADFEYDSPLEMPGRRWVLHYRSGAGFVAPTAQLLPWLVAMGGLLVTMLLHSVSRASERWQTLAEELRRAEQAVRVQATHDPLTGLANRTLFMDRLHNAIHRAERHQHSFALIYLDIDGFKPVNDTYGHGAGDELLKAISARMLAKVRKEDTVARLGGDEFAIILEQAGQPSDVSLRICENILAHLREPFTLSLPMGPLTVRVGASIGLALYGEHGDHSDALIAAADRAMYKAKKAGGSRCLLATPSDAD